MPRAYRRTDRVNELLREELAQLIRQLKDPRVGIVTITGVETSPELDVARVYVQLFGDDARQHEALGGLQRAAGYLRGRLARTLRLRKMPELRFVLDRTLERATRIERLLAEIRAGREGGAEGAE
ncbi:MAG: 30S ribosome-binding factor RbfA, partial [Gemmatimonadetes bacterium]|nr:30S ribosome-binding factor RbfA [Gemmatimonadota bacterium]